MLKKSFIDKLILLIIIFSISACVPPALIRYYPKVIEKTLTKKIADLEDASLNGFNDEKLILELVEAKVQYGYGYLLDQADRIYDDDYSKAQLYQNNAQKVFLDAIQLSEGLLIGRHNQFNDWINNPEIVISFNQNDVPYLYWLAASYGGMISSSRANPNWVIHLPKIGFLLEKAISIDPNWNKGALYSAMISYTVSRPDPPVNIRETAQLFFDKSVASSRNQDASPYISFAENISIKEQNKEEFIRLTNYVLDMDINQNPDLRLSNIISQERARWLQSKVEDYFYE